MDAERRGDYFDPYGLRLQQVEFANFMNEHCSEARAGRPTIVRCRVLCLPFADNTACILDVSLS